MGLPLIAEDHLLHLEQRIFLAMSRLEFELLYPSYITRYLRKVISVARKQQKYVKLKMMLKKSPDHEFDRELRTVVIPKLHEWGTQRRLPLCLSVYPL